MSTTSENILSLRNLVALQDQMQRISIPWINESDKISKIWLSYHDFYPDAMKNYSAILTKTNLSGDSSFIQSTVDEDVAVECDPLLGKVYTEEVEISAIYSTRSIDINRINQEDLDYFRTRTTEVADAIVNTDFEDGMENDITELIQSFIKKNKSVTYNWLNELFSKYVNNSLLVEGLLRTLAMVTKRGDENSLLPIVIAGLRSDVSSEQEAAIMVVEEWRTKECLDALKTVHFVSDWIKTYAEKVTKELEKEIG